jgi:signal transduction histidine kinase
MEREIMHNPEDPSKTDNSTKHLTLTDKERLEYVASRIEEKLDDYAGYNFPMRQILVLNIFFELAQELRGRDMFYATCMMIPRVLFEIESNIYILEDEETFSLAGSTTEKDNIERTRTWDHEFTNHLVVSGDRLFIPLHCNPEYSDMLPFKPPMGVLGCIEMYPCDQLPGQVQLFLEKYANRIGFQLHHRMIRARSREHLQFIKSLVQDIGHNVIVPNMYFKLYFNRLKRQIEELHVTTEKILTRMATCGEDDCIQIGNQLAQTAVNIEAQYQEIYSHYETTSMFLETLLRRRHFEEGRYVLEKREVNLRTGVVEPQLERYYQQFEERGIELNMTLGGAPDQMIRLVIDRGLISQVYANFFSNAIKYTEEVTLSDGRTGKFVSYGWQMLKDYYGTGNPGIKLWVTSTGKPLDLKDPMKVFKPGFRADNVARESGTGRGLYFVRQVVELHEGQVGYSHTDSGNEFYFILPFEQENTA